MGGHEPIRGCERDELYEQEEAIFCAVSWDYHRHWIDERLAISGAPNVLESAMGYEIRLFEGFPPIETATVIVVWLSSPLLLAKGLVQENGQGRTRVRLCYCNSIDICLLLRFRESDGNSSSSAIRGVTGLTCRPTVASKTWSWPIRVSRD